MNGRGDGLRVLTTFLGMYMYITREVSVMSFFSRLLYSVRYHHRAIFVSFDFLRTVYKSSGETFPPHHPSTMTRSLSVLFLFASASVAVHARSVPSGEGRETGGGCPSASPLPNSTCAVLFDEPGGPGLASQATLEILSCAFFIKFIDFDSQKFEHEHF